MLSPGVQAAGQRAPSGHLEPGFIDDFATVLTGMRRVWKAPEGAQPFVVPGGGTLAMEMAVANLVEPGTRVKVLSSGYFGQRMATMCLRHGAFLSVRNAEAGKIPDSTDLEGAEVVFVTHVDTSTAVRMDIAAVAEETHAAGALLVVDGVCSVGGEALDMAALGADVVLTASQKALGAPPGLALAVVSERALARRAGLAAPPPLVLDYESWLPVMRAYEARKGAYFGTPATSLVTSLRAAIEECDVDARVLEHAATANRLRAKWASLGLEQMPPEGNAANTLSALYLPDGAPADVVQRARSRGLTIAGGLLPGRPYIRVGHMGWVAGQPDVLDRVCTILADALHQSD